MAPRPKSALSLMLLWYIQQVARLNLTIGHQFFSRFMNLLHYEYAYIIYYITVLELITSVDSVVFVQLGQISTCHALASSPASVTVSSVTIAISQNCCWVFFFFFFGGWWKEIQIFTEKPKMFLLML